MIESPEAALARKLEASSRPHQRPYVGLGALGGVLVLVAVVVGGFGSIGLAAGGIATIVVAARAVRRLELAAIASGAQNEIAQGHFATAERLLAGLESRTRDGHLLRIANVLRGTIALRRGDLAGACERFDRAVGAPVTRFQQMGPFVRMAARAHRSVARALRGDDDGAREDVLAVRAQIDREEFGRNVILLDASLREPLARVALAEALVLSRAKDTPALREHLARHGDLMREGCAPRERILLRALERMLAADSGSIYRRVLAAPAPSTGDEPTIEDWADRVIPEARPFVRARAVETERLSIPAAPAAARRRSSPPVTAGRVLRGLAWAFGALSVLVLALYAALESAVANHANRPPGAPEQASVFPFGMVSAILVMFVAYVVTRQRSAMRQSRELNHAARLAVRDGEAAGLGALKALPETSLPVVRAMRALSYARVFYKRGSLTAALENADHGLELLETRRHANHAQLVNLLSAERAVALAGLGQAKEADAELGALTTSFSGRALAAVRVALLSALASGDRDRAARVAAGVGDDLPLDASTELLVDLVRATHDTSKLGLADRERLRREVRVEPRRAFVQAIAPRLLDEIEPKDTHEKPEPAIGSELAAASEAEAEAEAECQRALSSSLRRA